MRRLVCVTLFLAVNAAYSGLVAADAISTAGAVVYAAVAAAWGVHLSGYRGGRRRVGGRR